MMYGFKKQFVEPILAGTKTGTIRAPRAGRCRHARPGDALHLKSGPRFRPMVFATTMCTDVMEVSLLGMGTEAPSVVARELGGGRLLEMRQGKFSLDRFAICDGFSDWEALCRFWWDTHKVREFSGVWIRWVGAEVCAR
jgi:hypothetical protein